MSLNAYGAFAFESILETLGIDALVLDLCDHLIVFMDRSSGNKYRASAGASGLFVEAMDAEGRGLGPLSPDSKQMTVRLSAPYLRRTAVLEKTLQDIERRSARKPLPTAESEPATLSATRVKRFTR